MKKLVIAISAIAMVIAANAATAKWTGTNVYEIGSTATKASNYVVCYLASQDYSYADALTSLTSGDISFLAKATNTVTSNAGVATATITTSAGNSETFTGYLVVLNASTAADATFAFLSSEVSKATGATGQTANLTFSNTATQEVGNWYAVAPEPTSGLMMLLGMGVLALRRRRA